MLHYTRMKERTLQIGKEQWFIVTRPHALERIKQRCGNEVAIDDVLSGVADGYAVLEKSINHARQNHGLHVLCKIPFAIEQLYVVVFSLGIMRQMFMETVYTPFFSSLYPQRIPVQSLDSQSIQELVKINPNLTTPAFVENSA